MIQDDFDDELPRPLPPPPATVDEMLWRVIDASGWSRRLDVRQIPGTRLWQVVTAPEPGARHDDIEIIFTVSEADFMSGAITSGHVAAECRKHMLDRN